MFTLDNSGNNFTVRLHFLFQKNPAVMLSSWILQLESITDNCWITGCHQNHPCYYPHHHHPKSISDYPNCKSGSQVTIPVWWTCLLSLLSALYPAQLNIQQYCTAFKKSISYLFSDKRTQSNVSHSVLCKWLRIMSWCHPRGQPACRWPSPWTNRILSLSLFSHCISLGFKQQKWDQWDFPDDRKWELDNASLAMKYRADYSKTG